MPRRATLVAKARDLRSSLCVPRVRYRHVYTQAGTTSATMGFGGLSLRGHTCQAAVGDGAHRISAPISPCKYASTAAQFGRRAARLGQHRAGEVQERGGGSRARKVRACAHVYARSGRKVGEGQGARICDGFGPSSCCEHNLGPRRARQHRQRVGGMSLATLWRPAAAAALGFALPATSDGWHYMYSRPRELD